MLTDQTMGRRVGVTVLQASGRRAVGWLNGGGVTRDVAVSPAGASLTGFDWRISMAEVAAAGPFSRFEGVDRVLTVVAGRLDLVVEGRGAVALTEASPPYAFAGEAGCSGAPVGGAVLDLNVMVRRGVFRAAVTRVGNGVVAVPGGVFVVVALTAARATLAHDAWCLQRYDAVLCEDCAGVMDFAGEGVVIALARGAA